MRRIRAQRESLLQFGVESVLQGGRSAPLHDQAQLLPFRTVLGVVPQYRFVLVFGERILVNRRVEVV